MPKKTLAIISLSIYLFLYLFLLNWQSQERFKKVHQKISEAVIERNLANEPENDGRLQKFYFSTYKIITSSEPQYHYGDRIKVTGRPKASLLKQNKSGGKDWPLISEVLNQTFGVSANILYFPKIEKITNEDSNPIVIWAQTLRRMILNIYERVLPGPEAALLSGVVLGEKASLPSDFKTALRITGTTHVIAASGMNVTYIVIIFSILIGLFINKRWAGFLAIGVCWFYVLLAQASPPVVRAGVMGSMILLAKFFGREAQMLWVLVLTVGLMLLASPFLLWDIGFQLSVLSMAGLILFEEKIAELSNCYLVGCKKLVRRLSVVGRWLTDTGRPAGDLAVKKQTDQKLADTALKTCSPANGAENRQPMTDNRLSSVLIKSFAASFSAQLLTFPVLIYNFGVYSPLSLLVNTLVLWLIPPIMTLGLAVALLGLLNIGPAYLAALIVYLPLNLFVELVKFFGRLAPVINFKFDFFSIAFFSFGWYLFILLLFLRFRKSTS